MKHLATTLLSLALCCFSQNLLAQVSFDFEDGETPPEFVRTEGSGWRIGRPGLEGSYAFMDSVVPHNVAVSESFSFLVPPSEIATADTFRALVRFVYGGTGSGTATATGTNRFALFIGANQGSERMTLASGTNSGLNSFVLSFTGTSGNDTLKL